MSKCVRVRVCGGGVGGGGLVYRGVCACVLVCWLMAAGGEGGYCASNTCTHRQKARGPPWLADFVVQGFRGSRDQHSYL